MGVRQRMDAADPEPASAVGVGPTTDRPVTGQPVTPDREAMAQARQQGREEMTREVVDWLSVGGVDLVATRLARGADRKDEG